MKIKDIGDLEELLDIHARTTSDNAIMESVSSFAFLRSEWGAVIFGSVNEKQEDERQTNTHVVTFVFSYEAISDIYKSMAKDHRIIYDGQSYDIEGYQEMNRRDYIALKARYAD